VANESKLHKKIALVYNPCFIQVIIHIGIKFYLITIKFILSMNTHKCLLKSAHYNPFHCRSLVFSDIFTRPKRGQFLPHHCATSSRNSRPSDHTLMARIIHRYSSCGTQFV
jgi:membrane-associated phospholipid phosphatase